MSRPLRLHVLGGGPWQEPTVRLAKALGHEVLVTDMYPERPAYAWADRHEVIDITDRAATLEAARRHRVDGILCDTTDVGVPTAAWVAEQLGRPGIGYETALNFTDKARMRARVAAAGVPSPRFRVLDASGADPRDAAGGLAFPLMVKPVDNQSSRGVRRVADASALADALDHARRHTRTGRVLLEECVEGLEVIVDGFAVGGEPHVLAMAAKTPYADAPAIAARITYPAAVPAAVRARLVETNRRTVGALGLGTGVFHAEYIVRADGTPVPIDLAARGGGCYIYTHIVPHLSGVDANGAMIDAALGLPVRVAPAAGRRAAANLEFLRLPPGVVRRIEGVGAAAAVPGIARVQVNVKPGETVGGLHDKDARPAYLVALGATPEDVRQATAAARAHLRIWLEGDDRPAPWME